MHSGALVMEETLMLKARKRVTSPPSEKRRQVAALQRRDGARFVECADLSALWAGDFVAVEQE